MTKKLSTGFVSHCFYYMSKKHNERYATYSAFLSENNQNLVNPPRQRTRGGRKEKYIPLEAPHEKTHTHKSARYSQK